ncbi:unnamed protein product [Paramecium sonneborni]|uniref:Uncharacterized protein n=1 Tax=Paramecium sonneborni TaxID=65129 RepID=A0A8S1RR33_9CILI|nr:unnamed protein product [Paramecium sonneborni]
MRGYNNICSLLLFISIQEEKAREILKIFFKNSQIRKELRKSYFYGKMLIVILS